MISPTAALGMALALAAVTPTTHAALTPNCFLQLELANSSPLVHYTPRFAWNQFLDGDLRPLPGTQFPGAKASFESPGEQVAWHGMLLTRGRGSVAFAYNGRPISPTLVSDQKDKDTSTWEVDSGVRGSGIHNVSMEVTLETTTGFSVDIRGLSAGVGIVTETTNCHDVACRVLEFFDESRSGTSTAMKTSGNWQTVSVAVPYDMLVGTNGASVDITLPRGANYFALNGTVGPEYGAYTVTFHPPLPPELRRTLNTFNASQRSTTTETLYYSPLDPLIQYTVTVKGEVDRTDPGARLGLHSWAYCNYSKTGPSTANPKKNPIGAIIGGVVGGVALIGIAALVWFVRRRRRRRRQDDLLFTEDTVDATTPTPFPPPGGPGEAEGYGEMAGHREVREVDGPGVAAGLLGSKPGEEEERDAGRVIPPRGARGERPPPSYNPQWLDEPDMSLGERGYEGQRMGDAGHARAPEDAGGSGAGPALKAAIVGTSAAKAEAGGVAKR